VCASCPWPAANKLPYKRLKRIVRRAGVPRSTRINMWTALAQRTWQAINPLWARVAVAVSATAAAVGASVLHAVSMLPYWAATGNAMSAVTDLPPTTLGSGGANLGSW
jgi:hypothetical protein